VNVSIFLKLLDGVTGPMRKVAQSVASAGRAMEKVKKSSDDAFKSASNIKHAGDGVGQFAAQARNLVAEVVNAWEPFEAAMARVQAVTNASSEDFSHMSEMAQQIGAAGRFTGIEAAQGMEALRQEGFSVNEILSVMPTVVNAAVVSNQSLQETIGSVAGIMDSFGKSASEMASVIDVTNAAAKAGGTPMASMASVLGLLGDDAQEAGISFERMAALAGMLATKNIEGGKAAGTLSLMLKTMSRPTGEAARIFKMFGVTTTETVNGVKKMKDPLQIVTELHKNMAKEGSTSNDVSRAMFAMFGRNATIIQALMQAAKDPAMEKMNEAIKTATGTTAGMSSVMQKTGEGSAKQMHGALHELAVVIGETLSPAVGTLRAIVTRLATSLTAWVKEHPGLTRALGITAIAVAAAGTAFTGLLSVMSAIVAGKAIAILAEGLGVKLPLAILKGIVPATWAAVAPFAAVALAVGAVTLAVVQLVKAWDTLDMGEALQGVQAALGDGSFWKTMTINPFDGLFGGESGAPIAAELGDAVASSEGGPLMSAEPPRGQIDVNISSDGRPTVTKVKATGVDLDASAGMLMSN
jgi:TP901 family phage tail tape measure protein